jgi:hypothetical protein
MIKLYGCPQLVYNGNSPIKQTVLNLNTHWNRSNSRMGELNTEENPEQHSEQAEKIKYQINLERVARDINRNFK